MIRLIGLIYLFYCICVVQSSYDDKRCKCSCKFPPSLNFNITQIYVIKIVDFKFCDKKHMLPNWNPKYYDHCVCNYQERKTITIKTVVILLLVIISTLTAYMIFMTLLEPLCARVKSSRFGNFLSNRRWRFSGSNAGILGGGGINGKALPEEGSGWTSAWGWKNYNDINDTVAHLTNIGEDGGSVGAARSSAFFNDVNNEGGGGDEPDLRTDDEAPLHLSSPSAFNNRNPNNNKNNNRRGMTGTAAAIPTNAAHMPSPTAIVIGGSGVGPFAASSSNKHGSRTKTHSISEVIGQARHKQKRWRSNVAEQRERVYHDHSILN